MDDDIKKLIGKYPGRYYHVLDDGRIFCDLCPRACVLKDGDRGFCFVRQNQQGKMVLTTYGLSTGFCVDPVEKKPLNHFYPGSSVLSFGTAGCNLGCKFCQNWSISKSREIAQLSQLATPKDIAAKALELGCKSVAFTYNDPVIWAEYAIDTAKACHEVGIKTIAVTAGFIKDTARAEFYEHMDAANVDLKAFSQEFYRKLCLASIEPVKETIIWLKQNTNVWFELTNLIIPTKNDAKEELKEMCQWILTNLGDKVPIHFTAFHPDFRMGDIAPTPEVTLVNAYDLAISAGLKYVYLGNILNASHQNTYCPNWKQLVIERNWYELGQFNIENQACKFCGELVDGYFDKNCGNWGRKRMPISFSA